MKKNIIILIVCTLLAGFVLSVACISANTSKEQLYGILVPLSVSYGSLLIVGIFIAGKLANRIVLPFKKLSESLNRYVTGESIQVAKPQSNFKELSDILFVFNNILNRLNNYISKAKQENKKSAIILDNIDEGILILDKEQDVLLSNARAREIFGVINDTSDTNILHFIRDPRIIKRLDSAQEKKKSKYFDINNPKTGKTYRYYTSFVPEEALGKDAEGMLVLIRDVTEILQAEQVRKDFTSNVNEQMKAPLMSVIDTLQKLKKSSKKGTEQFKLIKSAINNSVSLKGLINDAMQITEIENMDIDKNMVPVNLKKVVECVGKEYQEDIKDKNLKFNVLGNAEIIANEQRMRELISNLISNAVKYNKDNGKVSIKLEQTDKAAVIEVSDTGKGIEDTDKERIFERFYRNPKSIEEDDAPGSGLGLSIVKHIIRLYNGDISIKSKPGEGTKITITLPLKRKQSIKKITN